jgi:hypothetical protein
VSEVPVDGWNKWRLHARASKTDAEQDKAWCFLGERASCAGTWSAASLNGDVQEIVGGDNNEHLVRIKSGRLKMIGKIITAASKNWVVFSTNFTGKKESNLRVVSCGV